MNTPCQYQPPHASTHAEQNPITPSHLRPHPGHEETSWDSPIETPHHRLHDHHATPKHHDNNHDNNHSRSSTPLSAPADPGFEAPWDSPILSANDPETPPSETDEPESPRHEAAAAHPQQKPNQDKVSHHRSLPVQRAELKIQATQRVEHPALGTSDGAFGRARGRGVQGVVLRDGDSRGEFLARMMGI